MSENLFDQEKKPKISESPESPKRESLSLEDKIKYLLSHIDRFLNEWVIMDDKWIVSENYEKISGRHKEEWGKIQKNKLRRNWFQNICDVAYLSREMLDKSSCETLNKKLSDLIKEVHLIQARDKKMNKELAEKGDELLKEFKDLLEKKLQGMSE